MQVNIHEAKTKLSKLIAAVEAGESVIISRAGTPVVRLTSLKQSKKAKEPAQKTRPEKRQKPFGCMKGLVHYDPDDIMAPLPDDIWDHSSDKPDPFL